MRFVYSLLFYLAMPVVVLRLLWKSRRLPDYRRRIHERFAIAMTKRSPVDIWIHAVSLGEVIAATPLIHALLERHLQVLITTMTPTGSRQVQQTFADRVVHQYIPYDIPDAWRRFYTIYQPKLAIIMETELWPNMIWQAKKMHIPVMMINARISDRAFQQYYKARFIFKPLLNQLTHILAQSTLDAERFCTLGASLSQVVVSGNLKYDQPSIPLDTSQCSLIRASLGEGRVIVIAASTHDNEEEQLLQHVSQLQSAIKNVLLLIAPRHPERFQSVYQLCQRYGFRTGLRSQLHSSVNAQLDVVVVDTLGELKLFYALSDYAFVGGSLVPIGGHNVLEPIAAQVPVFCGVHMQNARAVCEELVAQGALQQVADAESLIQGIIHLHHHPELRAKQVSKALEVLQANQGAMARCLDWILLSLRAQRSNPAAFQA